MSELRETIRTVLGEGTTVDFGKGPIGLLPDHVLNRLVTTLTDAVLDTAMFLALTNTCTCDRSVIEKDGRRPIRVNWWADPACDTHGDHIRNDAWAGVGYDRH